MKEKEELPASIENELFRQALGGRYSTGAIQPHYNPFATSILSSRHKTCPRTNSGHPVRSRCRR